MRNLLWLVITCVLRARRIHPIASIEPTQMQAKITVQTDQPGFCAYRASRGAAFSSNLADLTDNTNTDARAGSIVNANVHVFVLGTRTGNDALAAAATYWVGVTCGSDAEVAATFATRSIAWGNTAPDPVPFNAAKFGNTDYPVIDWTNQQQSYVDPVTGVEFWRVTSPGMMSVSALKSGRLRTRAFSVFRWMRVEPGKWASIANISSNGASFSVGSGGPSDKAFIPLANFTCPAGTTFAGWYPKCTVDDLSFDVYCGNAAASGTTITLQLSMDGGQTVCWESGNDIGVSNQRAGEARDLSATGGESAVLVVGIHAAASLGGSSVWNGERCGTRGDAAKSGRYAELLRYGLGERHADSDQWDLLSCRRPSVARRF